MGKVKGKFKSFPSRVWTPSSSVSVSRIKLPLEVKTWLMLTLLPEFDLRRPGEVILRQTSPLLMMDVHYVVMVGRESSGLELKDLGSNLVSAAC